MPECCRRVAWAVGVSLAAFGVLEPSALSQTRAKTPSAEAFSACRDQEKVGDARACWVVWLQRFRATGSESEVAYAEEHAGGLRAPAPSSEPAPPSAPSSRPSTPTPAPVSSPPVVPPLPAAQPAAPSTGYRPGDVFDFCALEPKKDATKFQKQRVVLFAPAEAGQINDDPQIQKQDGGKLVRDIFTARFPLPRFNNVVTELPADAGWANHETLSLDEIQKYVGQPDPEGDPERTARIDRERQFVAYSIGCADYVVAPAITSHKAIWEERKIKSKKGAEITVKALTLTLDGQLAIFKRDGTRFTRIASIKAHVPTLADTLSDAAAEAVPDVNVGGVDVLDTAMKLPDLPKYVSAVPDLTCLAGKVGREGVKALLSCAGEGTAEQALGGIDERLGPVCRKAASASDEDRDDLMVQCEVRARAFQLSRAFQKEARSVDGWRLFAPLASKQDSPAISLGHDEGLKVGYAFQALDPQGERLAFYKVTDVGAGGEKGESDPSSLSLRAGDAPVGARLDEYPQLGLVITPFGTAGFVGLNSAPTVLQVGGQTVQYTLPSFVVGGGADFGWELSGLLGWTETYARVSGAFMAGSGAGTQGTFVPIDLWFEKGFYLGKLLTFETALGPTLQIVNLTVVTPSPGSTALPKDLHLSATQYGAAARAGLDLYLGPDWGARAEIFARVPLTAASYSEKDNQPMAGFDQRSDHYATLGLNIGITRGF